MFAITMSKGFRITFANGVTISVQFGPGNYCERYNSTFSDVLDKNNQFWESPDAEVAILLPNGEFYRIQEHGDVIGRQSPEDVAKWIEVARNL